MISCLRSCLSDVYHSWHLLASWLASTAGHAVTTQTWNLYTRKTLAQHRHPPFHSCFFWRLGRTWFYLKPVQGHAAWFFPARTMVPRKPTLTCAKEETEKKVGRSSYEVSRELVFRKFWSWHCYKRFYTIKWFFWCIVRLFLVTCDFGTLIGHLYPNISDSTGFEP